MCISVYLGSDTCCNFGTGFLIPKGWKVMPLFRNIHHNPEYFVEPKNFDPSRFEVCDLEVLKVLAMISKQAMLLET